MHICLSVYAMLACTRLAMLNPACVCWRAYTSTPTTHSLNHTYSRLALLTFPPPSCLRLLVASTTSRCHDSWAHIAGCEEITSYSFPRWVATSLALTFAIAFVPPTPGATDKLRAVHTPVHRTRCWECMPCAASLARVVRDLFGRCASPAVGFVLGLVLRGLSARVVVRQSVSCPTCSSPSCASNFADQSLAQALDVGSLCTLHLSGRVGGLLFAPCQLGVDVRRVRLSLMWQTARLYTHSLSNPMVSSLPWQGASSYSDGGRNHSRVCACVLTHRGLAFVSSRWLSLSRLRRGLWLVCLFVRLGWRAMRRPCAAAAAGRGCETHFGFSRRPTVVIATAENVDPPVPRTNPSSRDTTPMALSPLSRGGAGQSAAPPTPPHHGASPPPSASASPSTPSTTPSNTTAATAASSTVTPSSVASAAVANGAPPASATPPAAAVASPSSPPPDPATPAIAVEQAAEQPSRPLALSRPGTPHHRRPSEERERSPADVSTSDIPEPPGGYKVGYEELHVDLAALNAWIDSTLSNCQMTCPECGSEFVATFD